MEEHHNHNHKTVTSDVLVVGAGIAGISTALEIAETGFTASLIEKQPFIGGRVARTNKYFPKLCPPQCGLEVNYKRLKSNKNAELFTMAEVIDIKGKKGDYKVQVKIKPRYIKEDALDGDLETCSQECGVEISNEFNLGLDTTMALHKPFNNAFPPHYVFEKDKVSDEQLKFLEANMRECIDLDQKEEIIEFHVKAIVLATGWDPYDAEKIEYYEFKKYPDVIRNVEMERLASPNGPYGGKILRPSDKKEIENIVFVQCAGSRDENHLPYCSSICCLASLKQARYVREQYPDADIHIFYIDIRTHGIFEEFYQQTKKDKKIYFHRGKVAKVFQEHGSKKLTVEAEDSLTGELNQMTTDMVVLATGMKPVNDKIPGIDKSVIDENGFVIENDKGIIGGGVSTNPTDVASSVQDATAAAIKAIQIIKGGK